jgi:hypothetical protein
MLSIAIFLFVIGFYCFYATSKRVDFKHDTFLSKLNKRPFIGKVVALMFTLCAAVLITIQLGFGAGILTCTVVIMSVSGLVILLAPLRILSLLSLIILFLIAEGIETIHHFLLK